MTYNTLSNLNPQHGERITSVILSKLIKDLDMFSFLSYGQRSFLIDEQNLKIVLEINNQQVIYYSEIFENILIIFSIETPDQIQYYLYKLLNKFNLKSKDSIDLLFLPTFSSRKNVANEILKFVYPKQKLSSLIT
jgi:hypothetical protein